MRVERHRRWHDFITGLQDRRIEPDQEAVRRHMAKPMPCHSRASAASAIVTDGRVSVMSTKSEADVARLVAVGIMGTKVLPKFMLQAGFLSYLLAFSLTESISG